MKFIDSAIIELFAGDGGKGCISFRREKYVPRGGPDGGNGGKGGDIYLQVHSGHTTLMDLKHRRVFRADRGQGGKGSDQEGRGGEDIVIPVPPGTLVYDEASGNLLADLKEPDEKYLVAQGGRGGLGNAAFTTPTRQAPKFAQSGEAGEQKIIRLELKLLADVGLVGFPNAGKSTFLSVISKARPKIADYPFTTLAPTLGVVVYKSYPPFTVADIPGLIEGAHRGKGLGIQFLKHIERTKVFLHLISLGPDEPGTPSERFKKIVKELNSFDPTFKKRKQVVALTKADLIQDKKTLIQAQKGFPKNVKIFPISAVSGEGLEILVKYLSSVIANDQRE